MSGNGLIQLREISKHYNGNVCALDRINLDIAEGEWVSIMGPSGSGKTTLLNILSCLDKPSAGSIAVAGRNLGELNSEELVRFRRETIGLVFQQFHLIPYLNALENVMLAQYFHSLADEREAREALERVGLGDRLHHLPSQLSGGEQQRVCIARALINQPRLILADEPTGNLDRENEELVMSLLKDLHHERNTLVIVTHDLEIVEMGQRIIRLKHGRVV